MLIFRKLYWNLERVYKKKVIPLIVGKEISKKLKVKSKNLNVNFVLVKK